jgi:hypothetical protein
MSNNFVRPAPLALLLALTKNLCFAAFNHILTRRRLLAQRLPWIGRSIQAGGGFANQSAIKLK